MQDEEEKKKGARGGKGIKKKTMCKNEEGRGKEERGDGRRGEGK